MIENNKRVEMIMTSFHNVYNNSTNYIILQHQVEKFVKNVFLPCAKRHNHKWPFWFDTNDADGKITKAMAKRMCFNLLFNMSQSNSEHISASCGGITVVWQNNRLTFFSDLDSTSQYFE